MRRPPAYPIESVDRALVILHVLRDQGAVTVAEVASELKVAPSTAHRLLDMLVYRDFAVRDVRHRYVPGPALGISRGPGIGVAALRRAMQPRLETLMTKIGETVNLSVRVGTQIRIIAVAETRQPLHVGNQLGSVLPADLTSGGLAELAELPWGDVAVLFRDTLDDPRLASLRRRLERVRRDGFAVNPGKAEPGVYGVGVRVRDAGGQVVGAIAAAMPGARYRAEDAPSTGALLRATADEVAVLIPAE